MADPARNLKADDAAQAAELEERELESGVVPAPESGTQEAKNVRGQIAQLDEVKELLTYEGAKNEAESLESGNNTALDTFAHKYGSKAAQFVRRMNQAINGGPGWHLQAVKQDNDFVTVGESEEIAKVINDKIDQEQMANRKRRKKKVKKNDEVAESKAELYKETIEAVENAADMTELTNIVYFCKRHLGLMVDTSGKHWKIDLKHNKKLPELVQAINSKKKKLLKLIGREKKTIEGYVQEIEYAPNAHELDKLVWKLHNKGYFVKKFTGPESIDFEVEAIKGKQGSRELVDAVNARLADLTPEFIADKQTQEVQRVREATKEIRNIAKGKKKGRRR